MHIIVTCDAELKLKFVIAVVVHIAENRKIQLVSNFNSPILHKTKDLKIVFNVYSDKMIHVLQSLFDNKN